MKRQVRIEQVSDQTDGDIEEAVRQRSESVMNKCWSCDGEAVVCQLCFHKWSVTAETSIAGSTH